MRFRALLSKLSWLYGTANTLKGKDQQKYGKTVMSQKERGFDLDEIRNKNV